MGVAMYVKPEREIEGFDWYVDGKMLAWAYGDIEMLCHQAGIRPLLDFQSDDPEELRDMYEALESPLPATLPKEQWFKAYEGLDVVNEMIDLLAQHPDAFEFWQEALDARFQKRTCTAGARGDPVASGYRRVNATYR